jgi:hypothetical protein
MDSLDIFNDFFINKIISIFERYYKKEFIFSEDIWYYFCDTNNKWIVLSQDSIQNKVSSKLSLRHHYILKVLNNRHDFSDDEVSEAEEIHKYIKIFEQHKKNNDLKDLIITKLKDSLTLNNFINKLNLDDNILSFNNGIYDISKKYLENHNYNFTNLSTNICYQPFQHSNKKCYTNLIQLLKHLFDNDSILKNFLEFSNKILISKAIETENIFLISGGSDHNICINLYEISMGDYFLKINIDNYKDIIFSKILYFDTIHLYEKFIEYNKKNNINVLNKKIILYLDNINDNELMKYNIKNTNIKILFNSNIDLPKSIINKNLNKIKEVFISKILDLEMQI